MVLIEACIRCCGYNFSLKVYCCTMQFFKVRLIFLSIYNNSKVHVHSKLLNSKQFLQEILFWDYLEQIKNNKYIVSQKYINTIFPHGNIWILKEIGIKILSFKNKYIKPSSACLNILNYKVGCSKIKSWRWNMEWKILCDAKRHP